MKITLPDDVKQIIETLEQHGYEGYAVGGCVRDSILGRIPNDWDITTSATPQQVKKLFLRTVDTGIQHGTVTVLMGKEGYEVTTYRVDGEYEDARHPKEVTLRQIWKKTCVAVILRSTPWRIMTARVLWTCSAEERTSSRK